MKVKKKRTYSLATKRLLRLIRELYDGLNSLHGELHAKQVSEINWQIQGLLELQRQLHEVAWYLRDKIYEYPELLLEGREDTEVQAEGAENEHS
jgi:hypothetical protein